MVEVYVSDASGNYHQIDVLKWSHSRFRDFEKNESFSFTAGPKAPIRPKSFVRIENNGEVIFRGATKTPTGSIPDKPLKWDCISIPELMKYRMSYPQRWGAPAITSGYEALTIEEVLGSDPPSQSAGVAQYVPRAIWMSQSYMSVSPDSQTGGVWYYPGWGTSSRAGIKNVYVGGHLCTEVDAYGDLTSDYYRVYRNSADLWVYGYGVGDFGPVCIDNCFDYGLRWGDVDRDGDYLLAALDVGIENYWQLIQDYLFSNGIYLKLRHVGNLTYLDGSINPYARGSSSDAAFSVKQGDWTSLKRTAPLAVPPNVLIGLGAGEGVSRVRYSRVDLTHRGAWIEATSEISEGQISPKGILDTLIDAEWSDLAASDYLTFETKNGYYRPGDWINIYVSDHEVVTAQIREISTDESGIYTVRVGGLDARVENAYAERETSLAVEAMYSGQEFGDQEDTGNLGPADTLTISFTPTAATDRDYANVKLSFHATSPGEGSETSKAVTYTVSITNTTYPGGQVIAILRQMPWDCDPCVADLPISEWCALDGAQETIEVDVSGVTTAIGYTITVSNIGRYGQSAIKTLEMGSTVTSTLTGDYYLKLNNYGHSGTTKSASGAATFNLSNVAAPAYDYKVVLVHYAKKRSGYYNAIKTAYTKAYIKTHSTTYYGAQKSLTTGYQQFEDEWIVNPYTGAAWTQGELDDLQAGIYMYLTVNCSWDDVDSFIEMSDIKVELR